MFVRLKHNAHHVQHCISPTLGALLANAAKFKSQDPKLGFAILD